jgi:uncharacterized membrane protein YdbT with pleckstrin-like domain
MDKNITTQEKQLLWKDKKHICGLPISFTTYSIGDGRLYIKKGLISTTYDEVMMFRIFDIKMTQSLFQKIFKLGTITVYTSDASSLQKQINLISIKHPLDVRDMISKLVEDEREEKGVCSGEYIGPAMY